MGTFLAKILMLAKSHYLFLLILIVAIFLRTYRLDELTTFGRDQGIDFMTVRNMVVDHKWTLIGIKTSVGEFFQGPLYLYMLYPAFLLLNLNPIAGPITAVIISTLTLILIYITSSHFFSRTAALLSTALFAVSPELVKYGSTPLYQHFLPLFIVGSIFLYLYSLKNSRLIIFGLIGLMVGLGMELHFLNITLAAVLIIDFLWRKLNWKKVLSYLFGLVVGLSPTIIFELKHQFLNIHLFINYLQTPHNNSNSVSFIQQWINGLSTFLGGNAGLLGVIVVLSVMGNLIATKTTSTVQLSALKRLTILVLVIASLLSIGTSAFNGHYLLPLWILLIILLPTHVQYLPHKKIGYSLIGLLIGINLYGTVTSLNINHGYNMPEGWTMKKIVSIGQIIAEDSKTHPNFNIASTLDGDSRSYPLRYITRISGQTPQPVENFPQNDFVYLVTTLPVEQLDSINIWEIQSIRPYAVGMHWNLENNINLYRLDRQKTAITWTL